jgi:oligoendopeptidase F
MAESTFELSRWSLDDLLPAARGPELDRVLAELEDAVSALEASREQLSPDLPAADFEQIMGVVETIAHLASRLSAYGYLWFAQDTQAQEALAFRGRMEKLLTDVQNRTLFFELWWKELDEAPAGRLIAASGDNRYYLSHCAASSPTPCPSPRKRSSTSRTSTAWTRW